MITREIKVGDRLRWTDPHDTTTTLFTVDKIEGQRAFDKTGSYWFIGESRRHEFEHVDEPQSDTHSGSKYLRDVQLVGGKIDVYAVLVAFGVSCPARQHAIKKLLCAGLRGKGDELQDLRESIDAVRRAIEIKEAGE
jgi:hypothetical protein